jgi:hypothetical protein
MQIPTSHTVRVSAPSPRPDAGKIARQRVPYHTGLPQGTEVSTAEGILPVEWLTAGDRVITRSGMTRLIRTESRLHQGTLVRVAPGAFGLARPARPLLLPTHQRIYLGAGHSLPVSSLVRGPHFELQDVADIRLTQLIFARPEIVTSSGVQLCCCTPEPTD